MVLGLSPVGRFGVSSAESKVVVTRSCAASAGAALLDHPARGSKSTSHKVISGLARIVAMNASELTHFEDADTAPSRNCDMRSVDQYWFKQSCKAFCGFMCAEIVVHGQSPKADETVIEYSNHRGYADGAIVVLAQNPPPLQIAVSHDPADADTLFGKAIESMIDPLLDFAGCLVVSKPRPAVSPSSSVVSDPALSSTERQASELSKSESRVAPSGDGAVEKIVAYLAQPNTRFWSAAEGIIGDPKERGLVSAERIRTGVTVAGLKAQHNAQNKPRAKAYALAIGQGSNACVQYGVARIGRILGMAGGASLGIGAALSLCLSKSDTTKAAIPLIALGLNALVQRSLTKTMARLVPNADKVLARKPVVHVQWQSFDLPRHDIPEADQRADNPAWQAVISSAKHVIARNINEAQTKLFEHEQ